MFTDEFSTVDDQEKFFGILGGGSPAQVPDESAAEEDESFERKDAASVTLYKVSDSAGSLQVDTISTKPIRQEMLKSEVSAIFSYFALFSTICKRCFHLSQDCFILDTGTAIYVWVGRGATQAEKTQSITRAQSESIKMCKLFVFVFFNEICFVFRCRLHSDQEVPELDSSSPSR